MTSSLKNLVIIVHLVHRLTDNFKIIYISVFSIKISCAIFNLSSYVFVFI